MEIKPKNSFLPWLLPAKIVDLLKNKTNIALLFLCLSLATTLVYAYSINPLEWIDIPNHFSGGMLFAVLINKNRFKKRPLIMLFLIALIGLGWERLEIAMTLLGNDIFRRLFAETMANKISDLAFGLTGLLFHYRLQD